MTERQFSEAGLTAGQDGSVVSGRRGAISRAGRILRSLPNHVDKNRGLLLNNDFRRMIPHIVYGAVRPTPSTLPEPGLTCFVATHHRVMTTYFSAVLRLFAAATNTPFAKQGFKRATPAGRLVLSMHGNIDFPALDRYRGVHIMRDPRDVVMSSYFYHKWTEEPWAHRPDESGLSYQQKLKSVSMEEGLLMEIDHFAASYARILNTWDIHDPDILELRFDDLMGADRERFYAKIFEHFGYTGRDIDIGVNLMRAFEAGARTGGDLRRPREGSHIRAAKSGQWTDSFSEVHHQRLSERLGPALDKFGFGAESQPSPNPEAS